MKAVVNGGLNLSVLDGWWDEGFNGENGWAIGERIPIEDPQFRDDVESDSIYSVLEDEIVPLFFDRNETGIPSEWIKRVKSSIATLAPRFNTYRMVNDYNEMFYGNAADNFNKLKGDNFSLLKDFSRWEEHINKNFVNISIKEIIYTKKPNFTVGEKLKIDVITDLGSIDPSDIKVEVYFGRIERNDRLMNSELFPLDHINDFQGEGTCYSGSIACRTTGDVGFKIRITPKHDIMVDSMEMNLVKWG